MFTNLRCFRLKFVSYLKISKKFSVICYSILLKKVRNAKRKIWVDLVIMVSFMERMYNELN